MAWSQQSLGTKEVEITEKGRKELLKRIEHNWSFSIEKGKTYPAFGVQFEDVRALYDYLKASRISRKRP
jgi:DNA-binding PadR family transcriptional regulator